MLLVRGSDSRSGFKKACNAVCEKECGDSCRKFNQRIRIYISFLNLYLDSLRVDYQFFGGFEQADGQTVMELYQKGRAYTAVIIIKKNS